jgi:UDP-2-acetamido-3-amino-2,3-dideoxy-glucuronate N-acetyltransferase
MSRIEPSAVIGIPCEIENDVTIWHFAHVMKNAKIGAGTVIGQGVHVASGVKIGERCRIQNGAQLFAGVEIHDDVFIGPHVVFTNILIPRAFVDRKAEFKPTVIGRGASIGANATILCGITIGEYAMIGAGAVVTKGVKPHELEYGNPAMFQGWVCKCGMRFPGWFDTLYQQKTCAGCGLNWRRTETGIEAL